MTDVVLVFYMLFDVFTTFGASFVCFLHDFLTPEIRLHLYLAIGVEYGSSCTFLDL